MKKNGLFRAASLSLAVIMGLVFFTSCKSEADAPPNSSEISVPNAEMPNDSALDSDTELRFPADTIKPENSEQKESTRKDNSSCSMKP